MRILIAHNKYQHKGGEDIVVENEVALLRERGHRVETFFVSNDNINSLRSKVETALRTVHNQKSGREFANVVEAFKPDVVHFHNFFPVLSLSAVEESLRRGIPTIQTLHNYRMICSNALFLRDGHICEDCLGHSRLPGIRNGCYRGSAIGSMTVARLGNAFKKLCHQYPNFTLVALTEFARSRFVADGFPAEQIVVKANTAPNIGKGAETRRPAIVFLGRLSHEKGVDTLIRSAESIDAEIEIIGDGPEAAKLAEMASANVRFLGALSHDAAIERIKTATALAMPSRWYEGFPMVLAEAYATGTPVIASNIGSLGELVIDGKTGFSVPVDNVSAWRSALQRMLDNPEAARQMGIHARAKFDELYAPGVNIDRLLGIYSDRISFEFGDMQRVK